MRRWLARRAALRHEAERVAWHLLNNLWASGQPVTRRARREARARGRAVARLGQDGARGGPGTR